ncbi:hypothetical protein THERMOT_1115 [Bathymodiolus thermophilus thioautotrophic gill symbiont]|nr:hypothetical protein THERMOT_1115 [Bathymodiolus thermophilus thioautotrophic gill symbiont]
MHQEIISLYGLNHHRKSLHDKNNLIFAQLDRELLCNDALTLLLNW